jgi:hypothetical protein
MPRKLVLETLARAATADPDVLHVPTEGARLDG